MKSFVTEGAGFIGSAVVKSLINKGHMITILDNLNNSSESKISHLTKKVAQKELGFNPKTKFCDGIKKLLES